MVTKDGPELVPQQLEERDRRRRSVHPELLKRHADRLVTVPMQSAAFDLDTPEDLLELTSKANE